MPTLLTDICQVFFSPYCLSLIPFGYRCSWGLRCDGDPRTITTIFYTCPKRKLSINNDLGNGEFKGKINPCSGWVRYADNIRLNRFLLFNSRDIIMCFKLPVLKAVLFTLSVERPVGISFLISHIGDQCFYKIQFKGIARIWREKNKKMQSKSLDLSLHCHDITFAMTLSNCYKSS